MLILDEPSNDLDFESETALLLTLRKVAQKHTVIIVTHSLRVASQANHIYHVRGDGKVDHGAPQKMLPELFGVSADAVAATNKPVTTTTTTTSTTAASKDAAKTQQSEEELVS